MKLSRGIVPVRMHDGRQPDLTDAALHLVGGRALGLGKRVKFAAELNDVAVAILPVVEQFEVRKDLLEACRSRRVVQRVHELNIGGNDRLATALRKKKGARRLGGKGHNHPNCAPLGRRGAANNLQVLAGAGAVVDAAPSTSCYVPGPPQAVSRSSGLSVSCELLQAERDTLTEAAHRPHLRHRD